MSKPAQCPECGAAIPDGQPKGLCPRCALSGLLKPDEDSALLSHTITIPPAGPHPASGHLLPSDGRGAGGEGKTFGDYELLEEIARGGMGVVFKARQRSLSRIVAVKMILAGQFAGRNEVLRFRAEAEEAARLQHPNIVRIYETGEWDGQPYFSMDYVEGGNLASLVREKPLPAKRAAGYVRIIAEAIHYAHEQGILHRDLKPSNVLIDHADQPRVTDFGLAKRMTKESFLTVTGAVMGSPGFMPPEQAGFRSSRREEALGKSEVRGSKPEGEQNLVTSTAKVRAGRYSDVYGLGTILFYLVTGRPPFVAGSVAEILQHVLNTEPVSPRLLNPSVPPDLATICLKCLEKEPAKRYQTAQQLAEELRRFLHDEPIHARPVGRVEKAWRWCRRRPVGASAAAVAMGAVILSAVFGWQARQAHALRLAEKRQNAVDKALLIAWNGDLKGTEDAIREAELVGASVADTRMLRGLVASHRGDYTAAVEQLEQAVLLAPKSVACRAMLMSAYIQLGRWEQAEPMVSLLSHLPARTAEDFLFRSKVESFFDPEQALKSVSEAVRIRPSPLARMFRAQILVRVAEETGTLSNVQAAVIEAEAAKAALPGNVQAVGLSLGAHLLAAGAYEEIGEQIKAKASWAAARAEEAELKNAPATAETVLTRARLLKRAGEWEALAECHSTVPEATNARLDYFAALALYRLKRFDAALAVADRSAPTYDTAIAYTRGYILAELPDGPARAHEHCLREKGKHSAMETVPVQSALRLIGHVMEARAACQEARLSATNLWPWRREWYLNLIDYSCGTLSEGELLRAAGSSRYNQCEAHYYIGLDKLGEGDRIAARRHFKKVVATDVSFFESDWAAAFLARMEDDASWPQWIPHKSEP